MVLIIEIVMALLSLLSLLLPARFRFRVFICSIMLYGQLVAGLECLHVPSVHEEVYRVVKKAAQLITGPDAILNATKL